MATPVQLGRQTFKTKKAAIEHCKGVLRQYPAGSTLSPEHFDEIQDMVRRHPESERKLGAGLLRIEVRRDTSGMGSQCFWLIRKDGTEEDVGVKASFAPLSPRRKVYRAFREAVRGQIEAFRREFFGDEAIIYDDEGTLLTAKGAYGCDVDHVGTTLSEMVTEFLRTEGLKVEDIRLDDQPGRWGKFSDPSLEARWLAYHKLHANLQCVAPEENQGIADHKRDSWRESRRVEMRRRATGKALP